MGQLELARTASRLIQKQGRPIRLYRQAPASNTPGKPWLGVINNTPDLLDEVATFGVFVVPQTSVPTESRGLAFDWVSNDLIVKSRRVVLVAALGMPDLREYNVILDALSGERHALIWGQLFQPGELGMLYAFGTSQ